MPPVAQRGCGTGGRSLVTVMSRERLTFRLALHLLLEVR